MNQQIAYLSQLKQTMELYQFMVKLCWLKTLLDGQVKEKSASGAEKIEAKPCREKSPRKSLSRQEKTEVSTIAASEVIKGRMYDFNNGRFLSVDPFIQGTDSQAINPYSYIGNNPLSGTDPTGYLSEGLPGEKGVDEAKCFANPICFVGAFSRHNGKNSKGKDSENGDVSDLNKQFPIQDISQVKNKGDYNQLKDYENFINTPYLSSPLPISVLTGTGDSVDLVYMADEAWHQIGAEHVTYNVNSRGEIYQPEEQSLATGELLTLAIPGGSAARGALAFGKVGFKEAYRLEAKALMTQGYNRKEAFTQIRRFNEGHADGFYFHFTTQSGANGILKDGVINASSTGLRGSGVYAGTTPVPSKLLKNSFAPGWGIPNTPVRVPFKTTQQSKKLVPTLKTKVFPEAVKLE